MEKNYYAPIIYPRNHRNIRNISPNNVNSNPVKYYSYKSKSPVNIINREINFQRKNKNEKKYNFNKK